MLSIQNAGVDIRDQATAFTMSVVAAMVLSDLAQAVIDRMTPTLIEHHLLAPARQGSPAGSHRRGRPTCLEPPAGSVQSLVLMPHRETPRLQRLPYAIVRYSLKYQVEAKPRFCRARADTPV